MAEPLRLLMIEDSTEDATLVQEQLRQAGFDLSVKRVDSEPDLVEALQQEWDVVILDYVLPRLDAVRALQVLHEEGIDLPKIVVSGTAREDQLVMTMKAGAHDYIRKDNLSRLGEAVRRELGEAVGRRGRREAEKALRESEERYRMLFENNPQPMWVYDLETLRFLAVNESALRHYGYSADEFAAMTIKDIRPPEDVPRMMADVPPPGFGLTTARRFRHLKKSGEPIEVEVTSHSISFGGRPARLVLAVDVTERTKAEEALRRSEEHFRSLIENASDLIVVLDAEGRVRYASPANRRILGYGPEEQEGASALDLVHPEDAGRVGEAFRRLMDGGGSFEPLETRVRHKDSSWRSLEVVAKRRVDEAGTATVVINARDVSERRSLEAQLLQAQKIEAVGRLAGGIAHDFNNLVTAILGYSDLTLRKLAPDSPLRHNLEEIGRAGERAAAVTQQLLAFSRKQVLQPRVLDLGQALDHLRGLLQRLIGEDIELVTRVEPGLGRVKVDPVQLEQVVLNLAINARDAMPQGGRLVLEAANTELDEGYARNHVSTRPGAYVMLSVSDTGHGMDRETQARIFEPFFTTKEVGKGTGLGLSTVYGIVRQSGGHIWVYSEPGHGTCFKIYLPRVDEPAEELPVPQERRTSARGSETILVVEDEGPLRELIRDLLVECGYQVLEAGRPSEALRVVQSHRGAIQLVVTDVVMPEMSGPELALRLAEVRPGLTKVLFLSGYSAGMVTDRGVLEEGAHFLQKPFTADALEAKVREVLDSAA